nr:MAG TPA: hypothetical protein [Caudoviricetes sp.]
MDYKSLIENEVTLQHHGVKGMKWGRRKAQEHRDTPLPSLSSNTVLNNRNFRRLSKASKKFVRDYNHDAKQDLNSVGLNYRKLNRDGKKIEKIIAKDYKKKNQLADFKNVAQGIAAASKTGLFKYDNPNMPTRRDYAQFLARDARVLSKMSREAMVAQMGSKDPKKVILAYNEALARSYGKGTLAGMRNNKIANLTVATAGGLGAAALGATASTGTKVGPVGWITGGIVAANGAIAAKNASNHMGYIDNARKNTKYYIRY